MFSLKAGKKIGKTDTNQTLLTQTTI